MNIWQQCAVWTVLRTVSTARISAYNVLPLQCCSVSVKPWERPGRISVDGETVHWLVCSSVATTVGIHTC